VIARFGRAARLVLYSAAGTALAFVLLEGIASTLLLVDRISTSFQTEPVRLAERIHTQYDPELGWSNVPNLFVRDMYGPGISLHINSQGFRGLRDVANAAPPGQVRLVCSGDSFALGHGVDDDQAWCQQLETLLPGVEPVNMGQGGYGIDQAYLWYLRDGAKLRPKIHVLAFISPDFARAASDTFLGYGKPVLRVRDGVLLTENVPVPRRASYATWWTEPVRIARDLRSVQLAEKLVGLQGGAPQAASAGGLTDPHAVATAIFQSLRDVDRAQGGELILVFLPTLRDHREADSTEWRSFVRTEALRLGIRYVDLIADFRRLPGNDARSMFILEDTTGYAYSAGHYSARGNTYVARRLSEELAEIAAKAANLGRPP
jgi:hypothetical protein